MNHIKKSAMVHDGARVNENMVKKNIRFVEWQGYKRAAGRPSEGRQRRAPRGAAVDAAAAGAFSRGRKGFPAVETGAAGAALLVRCCFACSSEREP